MLDTRFWHKYFQVYDVLNLVIPYQELLDFVCGELDIKRGEKILEAGSGTGNLALKIKEKGGVPVGFDMSQEGINIHRKKDPEAEIIFGSLVDKLPFQDNYFDKICSNNTLYTIPLKKRDEIIQEFYRILKPGGKIVLSNLCKNFSPVAIYAEHLKKEIKRMGFFYIIINIFKLIIPTIKMFHYNYLIKKENGDGEFNFFDVDEQKELLSRNGFKNISETKLVYASQGFLNSGYKI